jgi:hypothetical protein
MSKMLISLLAVAAVVGLADMGPAAAQSETSQEALQEALQEPPRAAVDFDQVFADVAEASNLDPEAATQFREELYRVALKRINAITYVDWVLAKDADRD